MKALRMKFLTLCLFSSFVISAAEDEHGHGGHEEHEHEHEHGHEEEVNNVGPNKGVTEASENLGFVLKDKVASNFAIQRQTLTGKGPFVVASQAILYSGLEKQVFRFRGKHWKAVDVTIIKRTVTNVTISSKELAPGDSIASSGVGFLKIIEQSVFGPAIEGHVH